MRVFLIALSFFATAALAECPNVGGSWILEDGSLKGEVSQTLCSSIKFVEIGSSWSQTKRFELDGRRRLVQTLQTSDGDVTYYNTGSYTSDQIILRRETWLNDQRVIDLNWNFSLDTDVLIETIVRSEDGSISNSVRKWQRQ